MPVVSRAEDAEGEPPDTDPPSGDPSAGGPAGAGAAAGGADPDGTTPEDTAPEDAEPAGPVLAVERAHLRRSREGLALMRANVLSLRALGGDRVSEEYLKADLHTGPLPGPLREVVTAL